MTPEFPSSTPADAAARQTHPRPVALVTGAGKRIGRSIALALAGKGWDVAVHYNRSRAEALGVVAEIEALGRRAVALQCELGDENAVRGLLARAGELGAVGCVVNSASLFDYDDAASFSGARLQQHMSANVAAPLLLAQALHAATPAGSQSVVINLLDQKLYNPNPDYLSYTLSKAALHSATTLLAQALAPTVRVVGVAPGITMLSGDQTDSQFEQAHRVTPLGKSSTPQDIAEAVCFVATASAMTGTTLLVDGGQHLLPLSRDVMFIAK
jgi:NAD(P)-dependent dehydrogenase (short-subunit alcohol dehydrogenase family)